MLRNFKSSTRAVLDTQTNESIQIALHYFPLELKRSLVRKARRVRNAVSRVDKQVEFIRIRSRKKKRKKSITI